MSKQILLDKNNLPNKIVPVGNKFKDITNQKFGELVALYPSSRKSGDIQWVCKCSCGNFIETSGVSLRGNKTITCGFCQDKKIIGNSFGRLTPIERIKEFNKGNTKYLCKCSCGNETIVTDFQLLSGRTKSCGCLSAELTSIRNRVQINSGEKFGKLTVLKETLGRDGNHIKYLCKCECGSETIVNGYNLRKGKTISCGCIKSLGEEKISNILKQNNILFLKQYGFSDLKNKRHLKFDFAVFDKNNNLSHLIEFDGIQHFSFKEDTKGWNTKENYLKIKENDKIKDKYCQENNIRLIRIKYNQNFNINDLL